LLNGSQLCFCISRGLLCALGNRDKLGSHFIQNRLTGLLVALRGLLNNFRLRVSVVLITRLIFSVGGIGCVIRILFGLVSAFLGIFRLIGIFALIRIFVGIVLVGRGLFILAGTIFAAIKVSCDGIGLTPIQGSPHFYPGVRCRQLFSVLIKFNRIKNRQIIFCHIAGLLQPVGADSITHTRPPPQYICDCFIDNPLSIARTKCKFFKKCVTGYPCTPVACSPHFATMPMISFFQSRITGGSDPIVTLRLLSWLHTWPVLS